MSHVSIVATRHRITARIETSEHMMRFSKSKYLYSVFCILDSKGGLISLRLVINVQSALNYMNVIEITVFEADLNMVLKPALKRFLCVLKLN